MNSDLLLKRNVEPLKGALERLLQLRGVTFEWEEPEKHGNETGVLIGMIGQEVEKVFPEWVKIDQGGYRNVKFIGFEALTVEALRELQVENEALKAVQGTLKAENEALRQRVDELEKRIR